LLILYKLNLHSLTPDASTFMLQNIPHSAWCRRIENGTHAVCHCGTKIKIQRKDGDHITLRWDNWKRHCDTCRAGLQRLPAPTPSDIPALGAALADLSAMQTGLDKLSDIVDRDLSVTANRFSEALRRLSERARKTQSDAGVMSRALLAADKLLKQSASLDALSVLARTLVQADTGAPPLRYMPQFVLQMASTFLPGTPACAAS
jgi:hypothetical protein